MLALLLFLAVPAAPLVSRRATGDPFTPFALVVSTWALCAGLCLLYLIPYTTVSADTWAFVAINLVALAAGLGLGLRLLARRADAFPPAPLARPGTWVAVLSGLGLLGLAWYVAGVVGLLGWRGFLDGERLRQALTTYEIPSTFLVLQFFCLVAPLVAGALVCARERVPWPARALAALAGAGTLITTDRTQVFTLVLSVFFMWVFARGRELSLRRLLLIAVVVPAILAANFIAVDAWRRNVLEVFELKLTVEGPASRSTRLGATAWRRATSAYYYATSSFPALDRLLADPGPRTGGALTFYPVARALERAHVVGPTPPYIPGFVTVTRTGQDPPAYSNAYSYLIYPLRDFGRAGAVVYSAALGLCIGAAFAWARRDRQSPLRLLVVAQVSTAIVFLPLFNKFNNTAWWYVLVWTLVPFLAEGLRAHGSGLKAGASPPRSSPPPR